jgi:DNA-directed RNA polymerase
MSTATVTDIEKELAHEEACLWEGEQKYEERVALSKQRELETHTDYGKRLTSASIEKVAAGIVKFLTEAKAKPGRKHVALTFIEGIEPDVLAYLTCRTVIDGMSKPRRYQSVSAAVGRRVENEFRFRRFEETQPYLYAQVWENLKNNPQSFKEHVRKNNLSHAMNKFGVLWEKWTPTTHFHVGSKLVEILIETTGLVEIQHDRTGLKTDVFLAPSAELVKWVADFTEESKLFHPLWQPMIVPPKPWTTVDGGGYYHERMKLTIVRGASQGYLKEITQQPMPEVYSALNRLQETPWRVNTGMLSLVEEIWEANVQVKGLPPKYEEYDEPLPTKPEFKPDDPKSKEAYAEWKHEAADIFRTNMGHRNKRMAVGKLIRMATKLSEQSAIFFPCVLDFRGRMYSVPNYLNPQGSDLAKSLLIFSNGKPLGQRGAWWLAVHVANMFGYDKVSLAERQAWTREHSDRIRTMAENPLEDLWWTEADKPFQFLAACIEWYGYLQEGESYMCHLPILVDGSCNGLQHFSAMLRDETCGAHVNLVPAEKPADIYAEVARLTVAALRTYLSTDASIQRDMAEKWLEYGVDRKMTKRPVMIVPYGGTQDGVRGYIEKALMEDRKKAKQVFGKKLRRPATFLAGIMWDVMRQVIVGPRLAMDWLRDASRIAAKQDLPVWWTTPSGFLVFQRYMDMSRSVVKTKVGDKIMKLRLASEGTKPDRRKQATATAPNFVHSLDASALAMTINLCRQRGIDSFVAVHDSYGTHPADMDMLAKTLREVFVSMYQSDDVLARFRDEMQEQVGEEKLAPLPPRGNLNLAGVLESDFFFS